MASILYYLMISVFCSSLALSQSLNRKICDERGLSGVNLSHTAEKNLLLSAKTKVTESSLYAHRATDGRVEGAFYWDCPKLPAAYEVDMGKAQMIGSLALWLYCEQWRIYQYFIEGSLDGNNWQMLVDKRSNSFPEDERGIRFELPYQKLRYLRVTIVNNKPDRRKGGQIVEFKAFAPPPADALKVEAYDDMSQLPWTGDIAASPLPGGVLRLRGWRGERVNAQLCIRSDYRLDQLHLKPQSTKFSIKARFVKFTKSGGTPYADIISEDEGQYMPLLAGINRSVWVSVDIPPNIQPGQHEASIRVAAKGVNAVQIPIILTVDPPILPESKHWNIHLDLWQYPDSVARAHGVKPWSEQHFILLKPLMKRLADAGQKVITTTIIHEAWNAQNYDHCPSMIRWIRQKDGRMRWDYSIFDKWVDFMINEVGIKGQISCYSMLSWSMKVRVWDEESGIYEDKVSIPNTPAYEELWGPFLADFSRHLEKKGWLGITGIALDERPSHMVKAARLIIKKYAPDLKIFSAINSPASSEFIDDISPMLPHAQMLSKELVAQRKARGQKTTYYVCMNPARPNTFVYSPLYEAEWLGLFAAVHDLDGFLRWAYNAWGDNPFESVTVPPFPDGDCHYVYPGNQSSPRFEKLRDGFEEFEKLHLIRKAAKSNPLLKAQLEAFLKDISPLFDKKKTGSLDYRKGIEAFKKGIRELSLKL